MGAVQQIRPAGLRSPQPGNGRASRLAPVVHVWQAVAGVTLVIAASWLPWATYQSPFTGSSVWLRGGPLSIALISFGSVSVVIAIIELFRPTILGATGLIACGFAAFVVAVALALTKIADANGLPPHTGAATSYAVGSLVGLLAALSIVATAAVLLALNVRR